MFYVAKDTSFYIKKGGLVAIIQTNEKKEFLRIYAKYGEGILYADQIEFKEFIEAKSHAGMLFDLPWFLQSSLIFFAFL